MTNSANDALRRLLWLAVILWLVLPAVAIAAPDTPACDPANPSQVRLQVSVSGMRNTKGKIVISIYPDQPAHFLKGKYKLGLQHLPVVLPVTHACFVMPAPGYYAVALFHDENNNNHFDQTLLGLPAEGYGFSNNPKLYTGPPGLAQVRFPAHAGDNQVLVTMQYY